MHRKLVIWKREILEEREREGKRKHLIQRGCNIHADGTGASDIKTLNHPQKKPTTNSKPSR